MTSTTLMAFAAGGYAAWLLDFMIEGKGLTKGEASAILGASFFGGLVGVVAGGRIADRLRARWPFGRTMAITIGMGSTVPCALICIYAPNLWVLAPFAIATMFFVCWYHGPMAASIDDLARPGQEVATQAVVFFTTHMLGTTPSSWVIGEIKDASTPTVAMLVPTAVVGLAALAMSRTFSSFEADLARVRFSDPAAL
jgi:MFS family permease